MNPVSSMRAWALKICCGLLALSVTACDDVIPDESKIEDLRILNIKTEPPEVALFVPPVDGNLELNAENLPAPDLQPVKVTILAAHPDLDAELQFDWIRCLPGLNAIPCEGADRIRLSDIPSDTLSFSPVEILFEELSQLGANADLASGFNSDPRELLSGLITNINVEVRVEDANQDVDTPVLEGNKRIVLFEPRLVAQTILSARNLDPSQIPQVEGISLPSLCTKTAEAKLTELFDFLQTRKPNQNPNIERVEVGVLTRAGTSTLTLTSSTVMTLAPGQSLEIRPFLEFYDNDDGGFGGFDPFERYKVIDGNCDLIDFVEDPTFSWFTNQGELLYRQTDELDPVNIYTAPTAEQLEADETKIRVFAVVRDGRGGSDHISLDIRVVR